MLRYRTKRKLSKLMGWIILPIIFLILGLGMGAFLSKVPPSEPQIANETALKPLSFNAISTEDYLEVELKLAPGRIMLTKNCTAIIMTTTAIKTYTIQRGIEGKYDVRPEPYDTMEDLLDFFDLKVEMVRLYRSENDLFYAELILSNEKKILSLDAKPSDALAVSTRFKAPIFVKKDLFESMQQQVC